MRVFLLDNYDSFTYNLYQYLAELGADVAVARNDQISVADIADYQPDRIVISPGPCTPAEAGISIRLIRELGSRFPILGVCLGHQASVKPTAATWSAPRRLCTASSRRFITMAAVCLPLRQKPFRLRATIR